MYNLGQQTNNSIAQPKEPKVSKDNKLSLIEKDGITRRILYVGENGKFICQNMVDLNYIGLAINESEKALKWLENKIERGEELPHAVICDSEINDGDIYGFFKKLSDNPLLRSLPFIVLARNANNDEKVQAIKMGVDDFYIKSFDAEDLHYRIKFLSEFKKNKKILGVTNKDGIELKQLVLNVKMPTIKRVFDIVVASTALILLSPVLFLIAVLVRLESKGPIFYISKRAGTGYHIFNFYKFRTMRVGADAELKSLKHLNQYSDTGGAAFVKIENDPRITTIGNFLRKSSLDELPQLYNVLKGDMSIVGNRPLPLYEAEQLTKDQWARRFLAPAGITGLWQVTKRGKKEMSESERMALDILYAKKYSFWMDMKIILRTIPALIQKEAV